MTEIKNYSPQDALDLCKDPKFLEQANFNQTSGPAYSLFLDNKLVACGGVRIGVGEAWFITNDENREKHPKSILRASREALDWMIREHRLWRLWAKCERSERFFEHLNFTKGKEEWWTLYPGEGLKKIER